MSVDTKTPKTKTNPTPVNDSIHVKMLHRHAPWGILAASFAVAAGIIFALTGELSFVPIASVTAVIYCVAIFLSALAVEGSRFAVDRLVTGIVSCFFVAALVPLVSVLFTVINKGKTRFNWDFFTNTMDGFEALMGGGGAQHAIIGSLVVTVMATIISVPIGIFTAIYLVEYGNKGPLARALTFFVDVMTGIPSIVAGLFAAAFFVAVTDDPKYLAGIVGAVALSVLMIPTVVKSTEEMLRIVPMELREASYALGVPKWRTITNVVLPTAVAGIATGVTLAIARVFGETAPLLVTVGLVTSINWNPFEGRMMALPVMAYYQYSTPGTPALPYEERAWAAALVLIIIVMLLNIIARLISKYFAPKTGR